MIVDTSALVAILRQEDDANRHALALSSGDGPKRLSAASYLEAAIVIDSSRSPIASRKLDDLIQQAGIQVETVTAEHAKLARAAYYDFGKASGHPAGLNFGDCFAYALAKVHNEPLLFKGEDFSKTDVKVQP